MANANLDRTARIPRNAIRIWQSNETVAALTPAQLTTSLRNCIWDHMRTHPEYECNAVHPCDWPSGGEAINHLTTLLTVSIITK